MIVTKTWVYLRYDTDNNKDGYEPRLIASMRDPSPEAVEAARQAALTLAQAYDNWHVEISYESYDDAEVVQAGAHHTFTKKSTFYDASNKDAKDPSDALGDVAVKAARAASVQVLADATAAKKLQAKP